MLVLGRVDEFSMRSFVQKLMISSESCLVQFSIVQNDLQGNWMLVKQYPPKKNPEMER